ncbi:MAG: glycosyltransferase family 39 protein [Thermomicrobiales bacterium]
MAVVERPGAGIGANGREPAVQIAPTPEPPPRVAWRQRLDVRRWPATRQFLLALIVLYVAKGMLNVLVFPAFTGHDEVAHYAHLAVVATDHRLPRVPQLDEWRADYEAAQFQHVPTGDYVPANLYRYCRYFISQDWYCAPDDPTWSQSPPYAVTYLDEYFPSGWIYTANHPPLYYLLMTPVYWATDGASPAAQQYALRAAAIPFGLLTILCAYLLAVTLFARETFLAITVPAFVAFQPQVSYEAAMLNNDIVAIAFYSLVLYLLVRGLRDRFPWRLCVLTGAALGLALLAKGTAVTAAPMIALAVVLGVGWRDVRGWLAKGAVMAGVAGLVSSPWFIFLYRTYGNFDAMEQVLRLQYWNFLNRDRPSILDQLWNRDFAAMRWKETWGMFGWRRIHLGDGLLWAIGIVCLVALAGLVWYAVLVVRRPDRTAADPVLRLQRWQVHGLVLMLTTAVVAYLAILEFGTRFELTQARYYFPAINAIALLLMLGLRTLIPRGVRHYGQAGVLVALLLMNVLIYTQYVIPYWHTEGPTPNPLERFLSDDE